MPQREGTEPRHSSPMSLCRHRKRSKKPWSGGRRWSCCRNTPAKL
uniref:Uncharacterized protein n=1 Tax=Anguilla anguilla TaxID=7936 RepID=A0A0E9SG08_ANGAN